MPVKYPTPSMGQDPYAAMRNELARIMFSQANIFGQQGAGFLSSQGRFDPNLAEGMRLSAFGQAQGNLSTGLADLTGKQANFFEQRRQFDLSYELQRRALEEEIKASKPNALDWITGIGTLGITALNPQLGLLNLFKSMFSKSKGNTNWMSGYENDSSDFGMFG